MRDEWLRCIRKSPEVQQQLATTKSEARRRHIATGSESQQKKYINVAAGDSTNRRLSDLTGRLTALGYVAQLVDGPLLLSTTGGLRQMPKIRNSHRLSLSDRNHSSHTGPLPLGYKGVYVSTSPLVNPLGQKPRQAQVQCRHGRSRDRATRRWR